MSYLKAMLEKKVEKEQLPKGVQEKIDKLLQTIEKISEYENEDDLDEDEQEQLEKLRQGAKALDSDIEKSILKFDPVKYQKQLEIVQNMRAKRKNLTSTKSVAKAEPEKVVEENIEKLKKTAEIVPEDLDLCEDCAEELRNGKLSLEQIKSKTEEPEIEEEEFEKVSNAKPRKLSQSVIIMGIGAFILTWGAVNFFRERRG